MYGEIEMLGNKSQSTLTFGEEIRKLRQQKGKSQNKVSKSLDCTQTLLSLIEKNKRKIRYSTFDLLMGALKPSPDEEKMLRSIAPFSNRAPKGLNRTYQVMSRQFRAASEEDQDLICSILKKYSDAIDKNFYVIYGKFRLADEADKNLICSILKKYNNRK